MREFEISSLYYQLQRSYKKPLTPLSLWQHVQQTTFKECSVMPLDLRILHVMSKMQGWLEVRKLFE